MSREKSGPPAAPVLEECSSPSLVVNDRGNTVQPAIQQLESEVRAELKSTVEDLESANEELKSSNQEIISTNEELRSANEELQASREKLQSLNEELGKVAAFPEENPFPILRADAAGALLYANRAAAALLAQWHCRVGELLPAAVQQAVSATLAADAPQELEIQTDGRDLSFVLVPIAKRGYVNFYGHDITARKRAEEALRESEARLSRSQEIAHLGSWELDLVCNRLTWSDEVYRIFGLEPQQFGATYEAFLEAVHPDDRAAVNAAYSGSLREGRDRYEIEHRVVRKPSGEIRTVHEKCEHIRDADGRITRSLGMVHDITEQKRAQEALRCSAARFERLVKLAPIPLCLVTQDGVLRYFNDRFAHVFGYSPEDIPTLNEWWQLAYPDEHYRRWAVETWEAAVRKATETGTDIQPIEYRVTCKDGTVRFVVISGVTMEDSFLATFLDVTGGKVAEAERERLLASLEEADQRKNEFLAMLSHELRNPLAPIRNSLYILDRAVPRGEQAQRALSIISRQTAYMARLVDDLLDVTRISWGKVQLQREVLDVGELVRRTVEDHRSQFTDGGIALDLVIAAEPLWVDGDATRLAQVIGNLLHNAAKFTGQGGGAYVSAAQENAGGGVVIRVRDTGVGVSQEVLPRLFEPFTQAGNTLDRTRGGLGLGLALVKGLVELHGGRVEANSKGLGTGAEFAIWLPLVQPPARPKPAAAAGRAATRHRILVIEDNVDAADSLREVLELGGHEVAVAYDGVEGIKKAREFRPEVVLCDIGLPGVNGFEVARAFRADEALKSMFLVALSGYALPEDLQRAAEAGFDQHLAKPPSLEKLEQILAGAPADQAQCVQEASPLRS
jgi:PAS domain S-box-containing protein